MRNFYSDNMKITFIIGQYNRISGGNRAIFEYANRLQKMGNDVKIYALAKPSRWYRIDYWKKRINRGIIEVAPGTVDWIENKIPINVLTFNDEHLIPLSDILVATAWQTAEFMNKIPDSKGKRFYFVQHHESLWTRKKTKAQKTYFMPFRKLVISTWLKTVLQEIYHQDGDVFVTPVNDKIFYREDKTQGSGSRVCFLHHDYDWKGFKDAIEAIKILRSRNFEIVPVVFGEKLQDPSSIFENAGFKFEYHYRPTGENLRRIYASCNIFLCPSWHEGLGMPSMEAMACGVALVTTDTGGSWDYALDGETALVSPPQKPEQLAENLARVINDEGLRIRLAENGCKKIGELSWDTNTLRLEKLFQETLSEHN